MHRNYLSRKGCAIILVYLGLAAYKLQGQG